MEMNKLEKVVKKLEELSSFLFREYGKVHAEETNLYYNRFLAVEDAHAMLKEQQQLIWELQEVNERLEDKLKKAEQQKFIAYEDESIKPIPKVVQCKDCKKRNQHHECEYGYHSDDWFCADGTRAEDAY